MFNSRQYYFEFGGSLALYTATIFTNTYLLKSTLDPTWQIVISVMPMLPATLMTITVIRALRRMDELQQKIQLIGFAVSFALVGLTTFSYGFLEIVGFPHIPYVWIFPFMIATWGISTQIVSRIYK